VNRLDQSHKALPTSTSLRFAQFTPTAWLFELGLY
jgi:hypothetical protein